MKLPHSKLLLAAILTTLYSVRGEHANATSTCDQSPGPWGSLLIEWATTPAEGQHRHGRILTLPQTNGYYVTDRIDRPSLPPPRQHYDEWPGMTPPPPPQPGKIVNRPQNPYKDKVKPGYNPSKPGVTPKPKPTSVDRVDAPAKKEVSETDLYLLGAIEKLVYRVDFMEKRLRKMEESVHYLVAGPEKSPDPCVENFVRVAGICYHFSREEYDWKTANLACRKLRSNLLELEAEDERRKLLATVQADRALNGLDYWTGGLNPGLLWIWSNSARPVAANASAAASASPAPAPAPAVVGDGRCLALAHDPAVRAYGYRGQDCALRHRFVCEAAEDRAALGNEIQRAARAAGGARREGRAAPSVTPGGA